MFFRRLLIIGILCLLTVGLIAVLVRPAQAAGEVCFAEYTGDEVTDFSSADASALRSAIAAASAGGTVKVAGTCAGAIDNGGGFVQVALVGKPLTLAGGYTTTNWITPDVANNITVLDAQGAGRVLYVIEPITMSGLTLTGGNGNAGSDGGGAFFASTAIIVDSIFTQNATSSTGGGALFQSRAVLTNTIFNNNLATLSGGGALFAGETFLTNTTFFSNTASGVTGGGGATFNGPATVANSAFIQNKGDSGGATFNNASMITNTIFTQNSGAFGGGALFNSFNGLQQHRVINVLFAGNSASLNGQAVQVIDVALLELIHTTIVSPTLVTGAAAIFIQQGTVALTNTIVASYTNGLENSGGVLSEDFNLFSDVTTPYAGFISSGGNSVTGTAAFANHTDYTLSPASAALDAGTDAGTVEDFFGTARPQGAGFEIGYAEFTPPACFATADNGASLFESVDASALRSAIAAASAGGTVKVAGTCAGAITEDGTSQVALITQTLTLAGGYATNNWITPNVVSNVTVLDGQQLGRVIRATAPMTVNGLTIQGGSSDLDGGGAYFADQTTVTNSTFTQNSSIFSGGGALFKGPAIVTNTMFKQNNSKLDGAGAYFFGQATLTNNTFKQNNTLSNGSGGGALFVGPAIIVNSTFTENVGGVGGGLAFNGPQLYRLTNVLLAGNSAGNGQAIYVFDAALLELVHTTIVSPTLVTGEAMFVQNGTVALTNTIVASHTMGLQRVGGTISENFNLFSDVTAPYSGTIISGGNSITGTAAFANHTDYKLSAASAAIDAGADLGITEDFFGTARPQGAGFEIGYAEFTPPPIVCFATTNNGATVFESADASALRTALAAASTGGTVKVAGTCAGVITEDGTTQVALITQTLTLAGGYTTTNWLTSNVASNVTVLDAQELGRVLYATVPVTVSGLTIQHGIFAGNGGGAYFESLATLINSSFVQNDTGQWGGGAYFLDSATLMNTSFISNTAFIGGGALFEEATTLTNTAFTENTAISSGGGAFIAGPATLTHSTFTQNNTGGNGGGAYFENADSYRLVNVLFAGNSASSNGQAIYVADAALLELIHTTIASPTLVTGPAVYADDGTVALTNTLVASHTAGLENANGSVSENFNLFSDVITPYAGAITSGGNSITGTAAFANHTDYTLTQASAAIDIGTNAGVNRDFFGTARPQGAGFEIGYAEFVPTSFKLYLPIIRR